MKTWMIENASQLTEGSFDWIELPSHEDIKSLLPGDLVRLSFKSTDPENTRNELLWVAIESSNEGKFEGLLSDVPLHFKGIELDDVIKFEETNIINFNVYRTGMGTPWVHAQECFVSRSVLEDGEKPSYVFWTPPEDAYDSGWMIQTQDDYINNDSDSVCVSLREVFNYDNSLRHILLQRKETSYYWDKEQQLWISD